MLLLSGDAALMQLISIGSSLELEQLGEKGYICSINRLAFTMAQMNQKGFLASDSSPESLVVLVEQALPLEVDPRLNIFKREIMMVASENENAVALLKVDYDLDKDHPKLGDDDKNHVTSKVS